MRPAGATPPPHACGLIALCLACGSSACGDEAFFAAIPGDIDWITVLTRHDATASLRPENISSVGALIRIDDAWSRELMFLGF